VCLPGGTFGGSWGKKGDHYQIDVSDAGEPKSMKYERIKRASPHCIMWRRRSQPLSSSKGKFLNDGSGF